MPRVADGERLREKTKGQEQSTRQERESVNCVNELGKCRSVISSRHHHISGRLGMLPQDSFLLWVIF